MDGSCFFMPLCVGRKKEQTAFAVCSLQKVGEEDQCFS